MTPVKVCSICTGAIVGFGNDAQPINTAVAVTAATQSASFPNGCDGC